MGSFGARHDDDPWQDLLDTYIQDDDPRSKTLGSMRDSDQRMDGSEDWGGAATDNGWSSSEAGYDSSSGYGSGYDSGSGYGSGFETASVGSGMESGFESEQSEPLSAPASPPHPDTFHYGMGPAEAHSNPLLDGVGPGHGLPRHPPAPSGPPPGPLPAADAMPATVHLHPGNWSGMVKQEGPLPPPERRAQVKQEPRAAPAPRRQAPARRPAAEPPQPTVGLAGNSGGEVVCPLCDRACEEHHRLGFFWRKFGYAGPPYCSRCSSVFRAHMVTRTVSTDKCSRDQPCERCEKVLAQFGTSTTEAFAAMDKCVRKPTKVQADKAEAQTPCPHCDELVPHSNLGLFWRKFGYNGDAYCSNCSARFRNHIIRQRSTKTKDCARSDPCAVCTQILGNFNGDRATIYSLVAPTPPMASAAGPLTRCALYGQMDSKARAPAQKPVQPRRRARQGPNVSDALSKADKRRKLRCLRDAAFRSLGQNARLKRVLALQRLHRQRRRSGHAAHGRARRPERPGGGLCHRHRRQLYAPGRGHAEPGGRQPAGHSLPAPRAAAGSGSRTRAHRPDAGVVHGRHRACDGPGVDEALSRPGPLHLHFRLRSWLRAGGQPHLPCWRVGAHPS